MYCSINEPQLKIILFYYHSKFKYLLNCVLLTLHQRMGRRDVEVVEEKKTFDM